MRTSSGDTGGYRNIYMMPEFYLKPENQFWRRDSYSPKGKAYFEKLVARDRKILERRGPDNLPKFQPNHYT